VLAAHADLDGALKGRDDVGLTAADPGVILTDTESTVARMGRSVATCCLIPFSKHDGDALELCMAAISESTALFDGN
jgi:hypothetical protein